MATITLISTVFSLIALINADRSLHNSVEAIKNALKIDKEIANSLKNVIPNGFEEEIVVKRYLDEHNRLAKINKWHSDTISDEEAEQIATNPIFAFQIMRRLSVDYEALPNRVKETDLQNFTVPVKKAAEAMSIIGNNFIQMQKTHQNLTAKELRKGHFGPFDTPARLTVGDCINLSLLAKQTDAMEISLQWSLEAHTLCQIKAKKVQTDGKNICDKSTKPLYEAAKQHLEKWKKKGGKTDERHLLCSDAMSRKQIVSGSNRYLTCSYLKPKNEPLLKIKKFKVEILSVKPTIVTIYDVITINDANHVIEEAKIELDKPPELENNTKALADSVWFDDHHDKVMGKISKRITEISGLSINSCGKKDLLVANYGLVDVIHKDEDLEKFWGNFSGNKLAIFLLYLSDVQLGGSTYFPKIGLAIQPKKGSATLIFNDDDEKQANKTSIYGGCPVILGNKWVLSKWM